MITIDQYCKKTFGHKLYKLSFNAGLSCPNRDGTLGTGGCIFCSEGGSGDFSVNITKDVSCDSVDITKNIDTAIEEAKGRIASKYSGNHYIAYFQAYSNTYGPIDYLRSIYMSVIKRDDIEVLSIATRPDCLNESVYELLRELNDIKPVWVELGFQTAKEESIKFIRRGYDNKIFFDAVKRLKDIGIHVITHVILYLPGENQEDMLNSVKLVCEAGSDGIKLQLLHVLKNTDLAKCYEEDPFYIPTLDEYVSTLTECLKIIPDDVVIHRLTGDPPKALLIEPKWASDKKRVLNTINNAINPPSPYYVYMVRCEDNSFYTGSTNDVLKRFKAHISGRGCKYTSAHRAKELIYVEECPGKGAALSREYAIKQLDKKHKEVLLSSEENIVKEYQRLNYNEKL